MTDDRAVRLALDVARVTAERDELRVTLARVEALADTWQAHDGRGWISSCGDELADILNDTTNRLAALGGGDAGEGA